MGGAYQIRVNAHGQPAQVTLPGGGNIHYQYNSQRQLTQLTDPNGHNQQFSVTIIWGACKQHTDALNHQQSWNVTPTHTALPLPITYTDAAGHLWHNQFDRLGQLTRRTDANGHSQTLRYGAYNTLREQVDATGQRYTFDYGPNARLEKITNPLGEVWEYHYDKEDRVIQTRDFSGGVSHFFYDPVDRLIRRQTPDGVMHYYQYDDGDRLLEHTRSTVDGTREQTRYVYDAAGRLIQAENAHATVELEYDGLNRVVAETVNGHRLERTYTADGFRDSTQGAHMRRQQDYNPAGQLQQLTLGASDPLKFAYDANGQETLRHSGQGFGLQQAYDARGDLAPSKRRD